MSKLVTKEMFKNEIRPSIKAEGKSIALCHGVFDLVHPGHIIHFEQASEMSDILVVSITSQEYVRKGPDRPYFNNEMRTKVLSAIECIDYVLISEGYTVDDIVEVVEPDVYVKGSEYAEEDADITGKIREERELVERHGGRIAFTGGDVFSSTKLINTALSGLPEDVRNYMEDFKSRHTMDEIMSFAERAKELKVLVIGDVIIDKYTYCSVQGLMSKDMGYSTRKKYSEEYMGGSVAIARHLSSFSNHVTLMSIIGSENGRLECLEEHLQEKMQLKIFQSKQFPTIVKHRYLMRNQKREEYKKFFAINNIPDPMRYENNIKKEFYEALEQCIEDYDVCFVCDFGHGLVDRDMISLVEKKAKYIVLNCQTNSTNYGLNIITKYHRADVFSLDQKELKLAFPDDADDEQKALQNLSRHLNAKGYLTRGSMGAYAIDEKEIKSCPAFTLNVKDTVGAGDAFFAVSGIFQAAGADCEIGTFMGNIGGALGAHIVGNKEAVEKVNVLKYASTLMNV